jgi:site-specific DNA-methyltransferase (adenine-specific)
MFPPQVPAVFIRWLTRPGEVVTDPFSGRGTVALEAARTGRQTYAMDANPLAAALSRAKVQIPSTLEACRRLERIQADFRRPLVDEEPANIRMLYSRRTLEQLVYLREALRPDNPANRLLLALTLGLLHGNHSAAGATRGFSISMPNTFAMSPNYVRQYIARHNLVAPDVNVFEMLRERLGRLALPESTVKAGEAWMADAAEPSPKGVRPADLVFTSPPYLHVMKYAKYNWVRLWFLDRDPRSVDDSLMATQSLEKYVGFMRAFLQRAERLANPAAFVCLVLGDVRRAQGGPDLDLATEVWSQAAAPLGWRLHGTVVDTVPSRRKVSRIWKGREGRATKTDRILILSPPRSTRELPPVPRMSWAPPAWDLTESEK